MTDEVAKIIKEYRDMRHEIDRLKKDRNKLLLIAMTYTPRSSHSHKILCNMYVDAFNTLD